MTNKTHTHTPSLLLVKHTDPDPCFDYFPRLKRNVHDVYVEMYE
jgi:hypothetical protein